MIPKVIHYCWFGRNPLPPLAKRCIASWKKHLPDYEIIEWNEDNFDVKQIPYTEQAYRNKKYAFVSDYARFKILYEHGGIYFDTDVESIKPLDDIIAKGGFLGLEQDVSEGLSCAPGLGMACEPHSPFIKQLLDSYQQLIFQNEDGSLNLKTVVEYTSELMLANGYQPNEGITKFQDFTIYPKAYFCPKPSEFGKIKISKETRTIHHYAATWTSKKQKFANFLISIFGKKIILLTWKIFHHQKQH